MASDAAQQLLALIGDILDIARIESGHLSLAPQRANVRSLAASVCRVFEGLARQKNLRWHVELDPQSDRDVMIDPTRFKQVLSNLLSNAIKFTREGEVSLTLRVTQGLPEHMTVNVRIKDSGIGIAEFDQRRLFSPFVQAGNSAQSSRQGSGLGLVISRTLCQMMGGRLQLHSALGQGTHVDIELDLLMLDPIPASESADTPVPVCARSLTVLVVDDYPANRLLLSRQLNYLGHQVLVAEEGLQGLEQWRAFEVDVLITDCNMPVLTGYELAAAVRDEERGNGLPPTLILGFTANAQPEEKLRCQEAGMDDCLFKPIRLADLSSWLNASFNAPSVSVLEASSNPEIDLRGLEQYVGADHELIVELLRDLAVSNRSDRDHLLRAHADADRPRLKVLAHRIKGGALMVRAVTLIECCERLEGACNEGREALIDIAVDQLQQAMTRLDLSLGQN